jgi:hypothetical protein
MVTHGSALSKTPKCIPPSGYLNFILIRKISYILKAAAGCPMNSSLTSAIGFQALQQMQSMVWQHTVEWIGRFLSWRQGTIPWAIGHSYSPGSIRLAANAHDAGFYVHTYLFTQQNFPCNVQAMSVVAFLGRNNCEAISSASLFGLLCWNLRPHEVCGKAAGVIRHTRGERAIYKHS